MRLTPAGSADPGSPAEAAEDGFLAAEPLPFHAHALADAVATGAASGRAAASTCDLGHRSGSLPGQGSAIMARGAPFPSTDFEAGRTMLTT